MVKGGEEEGDWRGREGDREEGDDDDDERRRGVIRRERERQRLRMRKRRRNEWRREESKRGRRQSTLGQSLEVSTTAGMKASM